MFRSAFECGVTVLAHVALLCVQPASVATLAAEQNIRVDTGIGSLVVAPPQGFVQVDLERLAVSPAAGPNSRVLAFYIRPADVSAWGTADASHGLAHAVVAIWQTAEQVGITQEDFDRLKAVRHTAAGRAAGHAALQDAQQRVGLENQAIPDSLPSPRVFFESHNVLAQSALFEYTGGAGPRRVVSAMAYVRTGGTMLYMTLFGSDLTATQAQLLQWVHDTVRVNDVARRP